MKLLQIFGWVAALHVVAFIFIFASPGCQSGARNTPTPDATMSASDGPAPVSYATAAPAPSVSYTPPTAAGRAAPTRPGSPNAAAVIPPKPMAAEVAPVTAYTVAKGDSLWSIAKKHGLTVGELAKANNVAVGTALQPGRKLMIPGKAPAASSAPVDLAATGGESTGGYTVMPGDTIATIARKHGISATDLRAANNRTSDIVRVGEKLQLPANAKPATSAEPKSAQARPAEGTSHVVQAGESLGVIARKYGVSVGELAMANNVTDPAKIRAGQSLIIPGGKGTPAPAKAASAVPVPASSKGTAAVPTPATAAAKPADNAVKFDLKAPPPGEDLDAGLKNAESEVPTVKVETPAPSTPPKN